MSRSPTWSRRARAAPGLSVLRAILAVAILSTGLHFAHNYAEVEHYPQADGVAETTTRVVILVAWPLLTAVGLLGYRLYADGRAGAARACLALYSLTGLSTPGHFLVGAPDVPAFWFATIFTDGLAGLAVLAFVAWSVRVDRRPSLSAG